MITYIFTRNEFKFIASAMELPVLPKHMIDDDPLSDAECAEAERSLEQKHFCRFRIGGGSIEAGIAFLFKTMGSADRVLIGGDEEKFTAFIGVCSILLCEYPENKLAVIPFETEDGLVKALHERNIHKWNDIRLEE